MGRLGANNWLCVSVTYTLLTFYIVVDVASNTQIVYMLAVFPKKINLFLLPCLVPTVVTQVCNCNIKQVYCLLALVSYTFEIMFLVNSNGGDGGGVIFRSTGNTYYDQRRGGTDLNTGHSLFAQCGHWMTNSQMQYTGQ